MKKLKSFINTFVQCYGYFGIFLFNVVMTFIALALISIFIGCVSDIPSIEPDDLCEPNKLSELCPQLPLIIDLDDSNIDKDLISEATEEWVYCADLSECYDTDLFEFGSGNLTINEVKEDDSNWVGYATWHYSHGVIVSCDILLKIGLWTNNVLIHELGHCLGIPHDDEPNSVMRKYTGNDLYILSSHINHLIYCQEQESSNDYEVGEDFIYFE